MPGKPFTPEQIIGKLREAEVKIAEGNPLPQVCEQIGVTEETYYSWRKEYVGTRVDEAEKLCKLEEENARLKSLVANMALDNDILREATSGNS